MIDVDGSVCGYFEGAELGHSIGWMDVRRGWYGVFIFNNLRMDSSWGPPRIMITRATPDEDYVNTNCINTKTLYYISNTSWSWLTWTWDHMRWHWCTDGQSNTSYHFLYWVLLTSFIPPTAGDHKLSRATEEDVDISVGAAQKTREWSIESFMKIHGLGVWLWWIGRSWGSEVLDTSNGSLALPILEIYRNRCGKIFYWTHTNDVRQLGKQDHWLLYRG